MRARITRELIERRGFHFVAVEADWPDAARIDDYVLGGTRALDARRSRPFDALPDLDVAQRGGPRLRRLAARAQRRPAPSTTRRLPRARPLQPLHVDRGGARVPRRRRPGRGARRARVATARSRPGRRTRRPTARRSSSAATRAPSTAVVAMLRDLLAAAPRLRRDRTASASSTPPRTRASSPNARALLPRHVLRLGDVVEPARPAHVRHAAVAARASTARGSKGIVWEHNSHVGNAAATEMSARGELNVGQLVPRRRSATARTSSASAPTTARSPRPRTGTSRCSGCACGRRTPTSYERLFHDIGRAGVRAAPARPARAPEVRDELLRPAARARHRRHLPARDRAREPLLPARACRCSSTSTSGSTRPARSIRSGAEPSRSAGLPDTYPFGV